MPVQCAKCHRQNPGNALYCYHDGSVLGGPGTNGGPINIGSQSFPMPFIFPSGRSCHNFDQLALACQSDWPAAADMMRRGFFEGFLGGIGRADLAMAAHEAGRLPDPDLGLDSLLEKLPTQALQPPKLVASPSEINLGVLRIGQDHCFNLRLENHGMRLLHGSITCEEGIWLALDEKGGVRERLFQFGADKVLPVYVRGKSLRASNKPLEAQMVLTSNGGNLTVHVRAEVPVKPFPRGVLAGAISPRQIAEKAKASPNEAAALLEDGQVARWYHDNGWNYPVLGPTASGMGALQQLFEALGLTASPKVHIDHTSIQLQGSVDASLKQTVEVRTQEKRPVFAYGSSDQPWLEVGRAKLDGRRAVVPLVVPSVPGQPGDVFQARVKVVANGNQRFVIPVTLTVTGWSSPQSQSRPAPVAAAALRPPTHVGVHAPTAMLAPPALVPAVPMPASAVPVAIALPAEAPQRQAGLRWAHLLPVLFLLIGLGGVILRDVFYQGEAAPVTTVVVDDELLDTEPRLVLRFHDKDENVTLGSIGFKPEQEPGSGGAGQAAVWLPSMRFGLQTRDPRTVASKRLTFDPDGETNNTVVHLDRKEMIFGELPLRLRSGRTKGQATGRWLEREIDLGLDKGRKRQGIKSIWVYDKEHVRVTQTVEIVPGAQSRLLDTCLVRYTLENQDTKPHTLGLRFMLDTFIGANDGVPFTIPGQKALCDTFHDFARPDDVPDFIQALEKEDLANPGTIAHIQLKLGGALEPPDRVTLGAYPNARLQVQDPRCKEMETLWQVPVLSIKTLKDSAVTIYWNPREMPAGGKREVGFAYGLGTVAGAEGGGKLAITLGGSFAPRGEFSVTAYVQDPAPGQTVTLTLPDGFQLLEGEKQQAVPPLPAAATSRNSPVSWKVKAPAREGKYSLRVHSNNGVSQSQPVTIHSSRLFD
jgi:hypothetical protein